LLPHWEERLELAWSPRQLEGMQVGGRVWTRGTNVPRALGWCILVCSCWGSQISVGSVQAPAETPAPPNPRRDQACMHKPERFPLPWPVHTPVVF